MAQQCCWPHSTVQRNASWNDCSMYGWFGFPWLDNEHGAKTAAVCYPPLRYLLGQRADITHTGVISVSTDKDAHAVCSLVSFTYSRAISVSTSRGSGVLTRPLQHPNWGQVWSIGIRLWLECLLLCCVAMAGAFNALRILHSFHVHFELPGVQKSMDVYLVVATGLACRRSMLLS